MIGDTVYVRNPVLRAWLEEQHQPYVLATAANDVVDPPDGRRLSAGDGAKEPRLYDWALVAA
jgi:hypothetical protein